MSLLSTKDYSLKTWGEKFPSQCVKIFDLTLNSRWKQELFNDIKDKIDCDKIDQSLSHLLEQSKGTIDIFPYPDLLFSAFNHTHYNNLKVVIIGQDPYFNFQNVEGKNIPEAMGLSFSIPVGVPIPSSLKNIYNNAMKYGHFYKYPDHGNLEFWAYQGVLLLNTALTVQKGHKNSHSSIWSNFTNAIIEKISNDFDDIVFVMWGAPALSKLNLIDTKKHQVLISSHPSGLSNTRQLGKYPAFSSIDQFGTINKFLKKCGREEIIWQI